MKTKRIAVIAVKSASGEKGGAERFYQGLVTALENQGAETDLIEVLSDESSFEAIKESYLRSYDLDLLQYFGVISTKAPAYLVRHPNHVCYLQHTMRVFYDMFEQEFPQADRRIGEQRDLILKLDTGALSPPRTKAIFAIGKEVKARLYQYNGLDSRVLYQASTLEGFHCHNYDYLYMPGRLHRWKRVDLLIKAMAYLTCPIKLFISGIGEDAEYFQHLAARDDRIVFLGRLSDSQVLSWYSDALCIPFVPIREDFGLVTLEAFLSRKPVITCKDSGEPTNIVRDGESGFICPPSPQEIASKIDYLFHNPGIARQLGERGYASVEHIKWHTVAETLLQSLEF